MPLEEYRRKRSFSRTPEPAGKARSRKTGWSFVIQKHAARRLHYDFRLELDGVLKSWAVPKGPSLDPKEKRLAVHVEDHPLEYGDFEGIIPEGEYGGGTVIVWDHGTWSVDGDAAADYKRGRLKFQLDGEKLQGGWTLVRMKGRERDGKENWLLIKERDAEERPLAEFDIVKERPESVQSGRTIEEVAENPDRTWRSNRPADKQTAAKPGRKAPSKETRSAKPKAGFKSEAGKLPGAAAGPFPDSLEPQLAKLGTKAPDGERWLHEIKFDGYRLLAFVKGGKVVLRTRKALDWTARFPELAASLSGLPVRQAVLDGEVVAVQPGGTSSFQDLQNALSTGQTAPLVYYVFDLLYLDGHDLRGVALEARKEQLARLIELAGDGRIQLSDHIAGHGPDFFDQSCRHGLEGIVSKRCDAPYRSGRQGDWLKTKCVQREEFVIGGFILPTASRKGLRSLLLGYFSDGGKLLYAGRVGTGFSDQTLLDLRKRLDSLVQEKSSFTNLSPRDVERGTRWVRPELVAHIEYSNWTGDGMLRHPVFHGLREDKPAREVVREKAQPVADEETDNRRTSHKTRKAPGKKQMAKSERTPSRSLTPQQEQQIARVPMTNPGRVLYAGQGITKLGLAEYYTAVSDWALPHLAGRPLSLVRCPEGQSKPCFYQKHAAAGTPDALRRIPIQEKAKEELYLAIDDLAGLISVVQMGVLEIHPWGSRTDDIDRPDRLIFDLDPDPSVDWPVTIRAARELRERLDDLGLTSFVKTTGGKGLHVVVPVQRRHGWDEAKAFTKAVVEAMAAETPEQYLTKMSKAARRGKIFLDYLRNDRGATAVGAYSTRAREGAPVSVPLEWSELSPAIRSDHFNVQNLPGRLAALKDDPWQDIAKVRQSITMKMKRKVGL